VSVLSRSSGFLLMVEPMPSVSERQGWRRGASPAIAVTEPRGYQVPPS